MKTQTPYNHHTTRPSLTAVSSILKKLILHPTRKWEVGRLSRSLTNDRKIKTIDILGIRHTTLHAFL